jgi:tetratricopeptide (TPR) repeat protein
MRKLRGPVAAVTILMVWPVLAVSASLADTAQAEPRGRARLAWVVPLFSANTLIMHTGTPIADCRDLSDPDRAIAACTTVNALKSLSKRTRAAALSNRCGAYQLKGMTEKAMSDCERAVRLDPTSADAFYNRGRVARAKGDVKRAMHDYAQALRLNPRTPLARAKAHNNLGDAYALVGEFDRALAGFDQAIRVYPSYGKAFFNRGTMFSRRGELDRAIADFDEALRLEPTLARALVARGNVYLAKRDPQRAIADYQAALRIDQNNASARKNIERARTVGGVGPDAFAHEVEREPIEADD